MRVDDVKDHLKELVDELPEGELTAAERYLEFLKERAKHPAARAIANAPEDEEELTDEELQKIREAEAELARGESISMDELKRELGL